MANFLWHSFGISTCEAMLDHIRSSITVAVIIFLFTTYASAQSFHQAYPDKLISDYSALIRWNGDTLFACGTNSVIIRSTDAGLTWTRILESIGGYDFVAMGANATGIYILPEATYYTASQFRSPDSTFMLLYQPHTGEVNHVRIPLTPACHEPWWHSSEYRTMQVIDEGVFMLTASIGQVTVPCMHLLFFSNIDGSWIELSLPDSLLNRKATICFRNRTHGFLLASHGSDKTKQSFFRTTNGGLHLTECFPPPVSTRFKGPMQWIDDSTFVVRADDDQLYVTPDFGAMWTPYPHPPCSIATFAFADPSTVYIVATAPQNYPTFSIFKTVDGGNTWNNVHPGEVMNMNNVPQVCLLGSDSLVFAAPNGYLFRTIDGGISWDYPCYEEKTKYTSLNFVSPTTGFVRAFAYPTGYETWYRTDDGGHSWNSLRSDDFLRPLQLYPVDRTALWGFYSYGKSVDTLIHLSEDGGSLWSPKYCLPGNDSLYLLLAYNGHYACGRDSLMIMTNKGMLRTLDRGNHWELCPQILGRLTSSSFAEFTSLYANNGNSQWWQCADRIVVSYDYGITWQTALTLSDSANATSSAFTSMSVEGDSVRVYAFELYPNPTRAFDRVYRTARSGGSWTRDDLPAMEYPQPYKYTLLANTFADGKGYALGSSSPNSYASEWLVYKTDDAWRSSRVSFAVSDLGSTSGIRLQFIDTNHGWFSATNVIYATTNGGIDWIERAPPAAPGVALEQNHPNPVRSGSTTTIGFTVSGDRPLPVAIDVFDLLGRPVGRKFSSLMNAGRHSVTWDSAGLPSGLYVIRLATGTVTATRKMLVR